MLCTAHSPSGHFAGAVGNYWVPTTRSTSPSLGQGVRAAGQQQKCGWKAFPLPVFRDPMKPAGNDQNAWMKNARVNPPSRCLSLLSIKQKGDLEFYGQGRAEGASFLFFKKQLSSNVILEKSFEQWVCWTNAALWKSWQGLWPGARGWQSGCRRGSWPPTSRDGVVGKSPPPACDFLHVKSE